jgi:uncharacterized protein YecT (DUF1311 family)
MPASRALVLRLVAIGLATSAPAFARAAGSPGGEPARHHFGDASRPFVSVVFEEPERPGAPCFLELGLLAANRIEARAATPTPTRASCRRTESGWEVSGSSRLEGREIALRASVRPDGSALEWTSPRSVTLRDGSVHALAGRHARLGEPGRAAAAREAFEAADRELNAVYRRLVAARPPEAVAALRADQRRWLRYRDFTLFDGDDAASVGPGTAAHLRQQGLRTLERVRYLGALLDPPRTDLGETLYSDGLGGTIAVRRLGDVLAFTASVGIPGFDVPNVPRDVPLRLGGVARPAGSLAWEALPGAMAVSEKTWAPERLRLSLGAGGRLHVGSAGGEGGPLARVLTGEYAPLRRLAPADAPLRALVSDLPAEAFDDTTDGLEGAERLALLSTGSGGSFTIGAESPDQLLLRFPGGHVRIALFAGTDGGAVLAVEQVNGRNLSVQLWRQAAAGERFVAWTEGLAARGRGVLHLDDSGTMWRTRPASGGGAASDGTQVLVWDGYGFVAERGEATPRPGE